ncbi:MAG: hypothetical protein K0U34_02870 [Alphaproteobacteria bacterium]|nr:hypothetical protein [Alphaproteobacteria bacterium]
MAIAILRHVRKTCACALALIAGVVTVATPISCFAAEPTAQSDKADAYTKLFDEICYANLPDLAPILGLAKDRHWTPLTGKALKAFSPEVPPEDLKAWSFLKDGKKLHVSISSGPVDEALAKALPAFAKSRAFACSLNLPGVVPQRDLEKALQTLVGRVADESYDQAPFKVNFWSGITDELAALMYHYKPDTGRPGGLISFVVLKK